MNKFIVLISKNFEHWYKGLSVKKLRIFWASLLVVSAILIINDPTKGYTRSYIDVKTSTKDEAISKWSDEDPIKNSSIYFWSMDEAIYRKEFKNNEKWIPEGGFFYRKKPPIWWIYGYESTAYYNWQYKDKNLDSDSLVRFKTLGGLINFLIFMVIITKILMWLTSIREARAS